jgi:hypothetical protein
VRRVIPLLVFLLVFATGANAAGDRAHASWLVQAGKNFQRAGEYTVRQTNTLYADAIAAYGRPSSCRVVGSNNHAIATWAARGIRIELWTYGGMPEDEDGCISPDLIHVSDIRLTDRRWTTSLGLRVGDPTTKLRQVYPRAPYYARKPGWPAQYLLVLTNGPCIGVCTPAEDRYGVDYSQLSAEVKNGRVVALLVPVGGQGE